MTLLKQSLMGAIASTPPLIPSDGQFSRGVCSGALAILFTHPLACIQSRMLAEQNATMTKIFHADHGRGVGQPAPWALAEVIWNSFLGDGADDLQSVSALH